MALLLIAFFFLLGGASGIAVDRWLTRHERAIAAQVRELAKAKPSLLVTAR